MYKVISTGSQANAVLYHNCILVDCGVPFALLKPYLYDIQLVLLTHEHHDHFNIATIKKLAFERPSLRFGCGSFLKDKLIGIKNIDIYDISQLYNYGKFSVSPIKLYHDVPNYGYRIFKDETKIIHATDTAHLNGIEAKGYDLYALEFNYNEETVFESIEKKQLEGKFAYQNGAINSHLSEQQAQDFIFKNKGENYQVLRLHESKTV